MDITPSDLNKNTTVVSLNYLNKAKHFDKELETIARKLIEKLLIFFINDDFTCPSITIRESDDSKRIILNNYLSGDNDIKLIKTKEFELLDSETKHTEKFTAKLFKIYYSTSGSKIILTADNREVTESSLHAYVPEFEDEFFDENTVGNKTVRKNYIIKSYVLGSYLDENVALERESFKFDKEKADAFYQFSQADIERKVAPPPQKTV